MRGFIFELYEYWERGNVRFSWSLAEAEGFSYRARRHVRKVDGIRIDTERTYKHPSRAKSAAGRYAGEFNIEIVGYDGYYQGLNSYNEIQKKKRQDTY